MRLLKNLSNTLVFAIFIGIIFQGCSSTGYNTANHNGKLYYFPENCSHFRYSYANPDELHCIGSDGELTGQVIEPADSEQVQNYRYQQEENQKAWDSLNRSLEKTNENLRKQNEAMMPKTYNVYHHYGY